MTSDYAVTVATIGALFALASLLVAALVLIKVSGDSRSIEGMLGDIHKLVNSNYQVQQMEIERLKSVVESSKEALLTSNAVKAAAVIVANAVVARAQLVEQAAPPEGDVVR